MDDFSDSDDDSAEEDDEMRDEATDMLMLPLMQSPDASVLTCEAFRQVDYLWLFDPYMQFHERPDFVVDEGSLSIDDYTEMKLLNRMLMTTFLSELQASDIK